MIISKFQYVTPIFSSIRKFFFPKKSFYLFSQVIALEAKLSSSKQIIEALTLQINELNSELEILKSKNKKTSNKVPDSLNSEEF